MRTLQMHFSNRLLRSLWELYRGGICIVLHIQSFDSLLHVGNKEWWAMPTLHIAGARRLCAFPLYRHEDLYRTGFTIALPNQSVDRYSLG